jgi:two-component system response regulator DesR
MRNAQRRRIVLCDDHDGILVALERLLKPFHDVVALVSTSVRVIDTVKTRDPDVVVIDVNMPGVDGLSLCQDIRHARPHTGIVVVSAGDDPAIKHRAVQVGAAFVSKFRVVEELLPAIQHVSPHVCVRPARVPQTEFP